MELEFLVNHSKQKAGPCSNRDKNAVFDSDPLRQIRTQKYLECPQVIENTHPAPSQIRTVLHVRLLPRSFRRISKMGYAPGAAAKFLDAVKEVPYSQFRSRFGV